jgi:hypothetical protein
MENAQRRKDEQMENPSENTVKRIERINTLLTVAVIIEVIILVIIL